MEAVPHTTPPQVVRLSLLYVFMSPCLSPLYHLLYIAVMYLVVSLLLFI